MPKNTTSADAVDIHMPAMIRAAYQRGLKDGAAECGGRPLLLTVSARVSIRKHAREVWRQIMGRYPTTDELRRAIDED